MPRTLIVHYATMIRAIGDIARTKGNVSPPYDELESIANSATDALLEVLLDESALNRLIADIDQD